MTSAKQQLKDLQQALKLLSIRGHLSGADRQTVDEVLSSLRQQAGETISKSNAAELLQVSRQSLDRWIKIGMLPAVKASNGREQIPRQALEKIVARIDVLRDTGQQRAVLARALNDLADELAPEAKSRKKKSSKKPAASKGEQRTTAKKKAPASAGRKTKKPASKSANKQRPAAKSGAKRQADGKKTPSKKSPASKGKKRAAPPAATKKNQGGK